VNEPFAFDGEGGVSARERLYAEVAGSREGRRSLVGVALALATFGLVLAVSAWQVTAEATALPMLRSAVASLTDIDAFLAENGEALRAEAARSEGPMEFPGYPLPVVVEAAEVRSADTAVLRRLLLDRSAALVYAEGTGAFDRTGDQAIDRLSMEGLLELAAGQLSQSTHERAGTVAAVLAVVAALLAALLAAMSSGWSRMRAPAAAMALGGVGGAALSLAAWALAGQVGGDDPFMADLRTVVQAGFSAGTRNGAIVTGAGLALVGAAWLLELVERRVAQPALEEPPGETLADEREAG
jgi:hypothetical protein